jgi:hypothetical protein
MKSGRALLSFCVVAMAPREAMLLKSFVRMLDSRTRQRWLFKPQQHSDEQQAADLIFLGDEEDPGSPPGAAQGIRQLRMGVLSLDLFAKLERPLRPDELERELNRMGTLLVQARTQPGPGEAIHFFPSTQNRENFGQIESGQPSSMWRPVADGSMHSEFLPTTVFSNEFAATVPVSLKERVAVSAGASVDSGPTPPKITVKAHDDLRLLRWPHTSLINTPARLKLAAFMTGSGTTLSKLLTNSGQSADACIAFIHDLQASGFLSVTSADQQGAAVAVSVAQVNVQAPDTVNVTRLIPEKMLPEKPASPSIAPAPNLFARIRARLGMPLTG